MPIIFILYFGGYLLLGSMAQFSDSDRASVIYWIMIAYFFIPIIFFKVFYKVQEKNKKKKV